MVDSQLLPLEVNMPLYEYECVSHGRFSRHEELRPDGLDSAHCYSICPECAESCRGVISLSHWKILNPFTKDGEGFTSQVYTPKEADIRTKYNLQKDDKV